jgi:glycosyltransferase involved in cell wall biosynthesis
VKDNDLNEFAKAINKLLNNSELRINLSKNARLVSENYTWGKIKNNWDELLK